MKENLPIPRTGPGTGPAGITTRRAFLRDGLLYTGLTAATASGLLAFYRQGLDLRDIRTAPDPVLRKVAAPVRRFDHSLDLLGRAMQDTLHYMALVCFFKAVLPRGLAGPQLGVRQRVIACGLPGRLKILVNPEIIDKQGSFSSREWCLSLPEQQAREVRRSARVTVRYQQLDKSEKIITLGDRYAALLEHEIDHLNGILYTDYG